MLQRRIEARHRTQLEACAVGPGKGRSSLAVGEHPLSELAWRRATAPSTGGEAARRLLKEVLEYPGGG
eukprot:scaffold144697_cov154-Phaeocystis_antarctica.AAC.1